MDSSEQPCRLLLLEEVAEHCRAPLASVRKWVQTGRLRSVRPGRRRLVARAELERFLRVPRHRDHSDRRIVTTQIAAS